MNVQIKRDINEVKNVVITLDDVQVRIVECSILGKKSLRIVSNKRIDATPSCNTCVYLEFFDKQDKE